MSEFARKVLVVAYAFPPAGGAGVQRPLKFVKYLKRLGWQPSVLTVSNPSVPTMDEGLLKDLPADVKIYSAQTLEPTYAKKEKLAGVNKGRGSYRQKLKSLVTRLFIPDMQVLWWPDLILHLSAILRANRPDVIFVTAPPFSSFVPVVFLGKIFQIPVVVDFRDEWIFARSNIENAGRGKIVDLFDFWLERLVLSFCRDFTAATQSYVDSIRLRHRAAAQGKGIAITNGYDEDDFNGLERQRLSDGKFRILYTGTVWKATSLEPFTKGVESLLDECPELCEVLSVRIIGRVVETEQGYLQKLEKLGVLETKGYCSHYQVLQEMIDADLLLLTLSDLPGAEKIIPGKLFEYLAAGTHIFAIIPTGETERIISSATSSKSLMPQDTDSIKKQLMRELSRGEEKSIRESSRRSCKMYSRFELSAALSTLLKRVVEST